MTAGLHHRWRDMGVMLARRGPGVVGARRVLRHRRLRLRAPAGRGAGGPGGRRGRLRRDAEGRPREVRAATSSTWSSCHGDVLGPALLRRRSSTPAPWASASATCPTSTRAFSEMRRVCRPGGRVVCLEITQPQMPVFKQFYGLWFDHAVPRAGPAGRGRRIGLHATCPRR